FASKILEIEKSTIINKVRFVGLYPQSQVENAQCLVYIVVKAVIPESIAVVIECIMRVRGLEIKFEGTEQMPVPELPQIIHKKSLVTRRITLLYVIYIPVG